MSTTKNEPTEPSRPKLAPRHGTDRAAQISLAHRIARVADWRWDKATDIVQRSAEYASLLEIPPEELSTFTFRDYVNTFVHPDDRARVLQAYKSAHLKGNWRFEVRYRITTYRGREIWLLEVSELVIADSGEELGEIGMVQDVTEYEHATRALKASQKQLYITQAALKHSVDVIVVTQANARIVDANATACCRLGYAREKLLTMTAHDIEPEPPRELWSTRWRELQQRGSYAVESLLKTHAGSTFPVDITLSHIEYDGEEYCLVVARDTSERKHTEALSLHQARHDALTSLPNRAYVMEHLAHLLEAAERTSCPLFVLFIDFDNFKKVNDSLGHEVGDKLLIEAANRLQSGLEESSFLARIGGDEFVVILDSSATQSKAELAATNVLAMFRDAFAIDGRHLVLTVSIGIARYPEDGKRAAELLGKADMAMYYAKRQGRDASYHYDDSMELHAQSRLDIEERLRTALEKNELAVYFQPVHLLASGTLVGAEALLRWASPELGDVRPLDFIEVAEQTGLIDSIGDFVLSEALSQVRLWRSRSNTPLKVAVNVSPRQLNNPRFGESVSMTLQEAQLPGNALLIEITESVLLSSQRFAESNLATLQDLGVCIAMDDFGTGYSSLSYLRNYAFDTLKIDRTFIAELTDEKPDKQLVMASIQMAHGLGMTVVAEGVETELQRRILHELQCDMAQGHFYSKALTKHEILDTLATS